MRLVSDACGEFDQIWPKINTHDWTHGKMQRTQHRCNRMDGKKQHT